MADGIDTQLQDPAIQQDLADSSGLIAEIADRLREQQAAQQQTDSQALQVDGEPTSRNQALFGILAAALPTVLGAALGGKRGALAGLSAGGQAGGQFLEDVAAQEEQAQLTKEELAREIIKQRDKRSFEIDKILLKDQLAKENIQLKGQVDPSGVNITNQLGREVEKLGSKEITKLIVESEAENRPAIKKAQNIRKLIQKGRASGSFKANENIFQAVARNFGAKVNPNTPAGELRRAVVENMLTTLKSLIKGPPSESERALIETTTGVGSAITLNTLESIALAIEQRAGQNVRNLEDIAVERGLTFPGKGKAIDKKAGQSIDIAGLGKIRLTD